MRETESIMDKIMSLPQYAEHVINIIEDEDIYIDKLNKLNKVMVQLL